MPEATNHGLCRPSHAVECRHEYTKSNSDDDTIKTDCWCAIQFLERYFYNNVLCIYYNHIIYCADVVAMVAVYSEVGDGVFVDNSAVFRKRLENMGQLSYYYRKLA